jgi:very-long-chain ceramide synthase
MLKYLEFQRSCDATFFFFLVSWPYTRHYIYNRILLSAAFDAPGIFHRDNHMKPWYQQTPLKGGGQWKKGFSWNPEEGYYLTEEVLFAFIALLAILEALLCLWFVMIVRLAVRVVRGSHAEDDRSDDEDDSDTEDVSHDEGEDVSSLSVANGVSMNGMTTNGIYQRKRE